MTQPNRCDRYPNRPILSVEEIMTDAPETIRAGMGRDCNHGHPSQFEGSTFFCGGAVGPRWTYKDCSECGAKDAYCIEENVCTRMGC